MKTKETLRESRRRSIRARVRGTTERPRLVVNRSLRFTSAQIVDDVLKKTLVSASDMKSKTKGKTARAKEVGVTIGKMAKDKGVTAVVFDRAGYQYHGRVKALADGAREAGLQF